MLLTQQAKDDLLDSAKKTATEVATEQALAGFKAAREYIDDKMEGSIADFESRIQKLFEQALEADRKKRYDSVEPFVEIISQTFSEEGGVQLRLDWNKPFIDYLKKNGVTGPTDEAIVDNWLIALSRDRIAEGGSEFK